MPASLCIHALARRAHLRDWCARFCIRRRGGNQLLEASLRWGQQNPMKPAREVCKDGCSASLHGEEAGFAVTKLGAEAGRRIGRAHGGKTTHGDRKSLTVDTVDQIEAFHRRNRTATGIWRKTAGHWRRRWRDAAASVEVAARLSDAPRCGAPATFTPEVICQIVALACKNPETLDVPISHWSQSELARQSVARGIVTSISHGSVGRFLKKRPISSHIATVTG
jgi:putative transposase